MNTSCCVGQSTYSYHGTSESANRADV